MNKKGKGDRIISVILSSFIISFLIGFVVLPKREFSENENRYLAKAPEFSAEKLLKGEFTEGLLDYITDHFPLRDGFVGVKTRYLKCMGFMESVGIYLMEDDSGPLLIEAYREPANTERIGKILGDFKDTLRDKGVKAKTYLTLVPTAVTTYTDKLPGNAPDGAEGFRGKAGISQGNTASQIYEISGLSHAYAGDVLKEHRDEYIYFRTDHHWTTLGAYYGTLPFLMEAGIEPLELSAWDKTVGATGFTGTLWSKSGDYSIPGEDIILYHHPQDKLKVFYPDTGEESESLYNMEFADKKDKYALFLNSLHPLVTVRNENAATDRSLVLIKDSYANAAVPFLAHYFREIHIFDTRYYRKAVSDYIAERPEITDILILYNMNTIDSDQGIRSVY